jgi:hypothetical protein
LAACFARKQDSKRPPEVTMTRSLSLSSLLFICLCFVLSGCQKSNQPATSSSNTAPAANDAQNAANQPANAPAQAPAPQPIVVPQGTAIEVVLDQSLSSKTSSVGQSFSATVVDPVVVDGREVIAKGAHARGTVTSAKAAGRFKGASELGLALRSVEVNGQRYEIRASTPELSKKGKGKRTGAMVGGGAGGGALIGGLAGGGKGALIGGLIGAGAGTGGAAFTGNRDVELPAETGLRFRLVKPLEIQP